ncbi:hypothetical protein GN956_G5058 [Arapaima gigas]
MSDATGCYAVAWRSLLTPPAVRSQLEPYIDHLKFQIQQWVEQLKQKLAPYAESLDTEALQATLLQNSEELRGKTVALLAESIPYQMKLEPYTEDLKTQLAALWESSSKANYMLPVPPHRLLLLVLQEILCTEAFQRVYSEQRGSE